MGTRYNIVIRICGLLIIREFLLVTPHIVTDTRNSVVSYWCQLYGTGNQFYLVKTCRTGSRLANSTGSVEKDLNQICQQGS